MIGSVQRSSLNKSVAMTSSNCVASSVCVSGDLLERTKTELEDSYTLRHISEVPAYDSHLPNLHTERLVNLKNNNHIY